MSLAHDVAFYRRLRQIEREQAARPKTPKYGRMTPAEAKRMAAALPQYRDVIELLTDYPRPVRAGASYAGDDEGDEEYEALRAALWPPETPAAVHRQAEAQAMLAASAPEDDGDELYAAVFGRQPGQKRQAARVAASVHQDAGDDDLSDDELYAAIYGEPS